MSTCIFYVAVQLGPRNPFPFFYTRPTGNNSQRIHRSCSDNGNEWEYPFGDHFPLLESDHFSTRILFDYSTMAATDRFGSSIKIDFADRISTQIWERIHRKRIQPSNTRRKNREE